MAGLALVALALIVWNPLLLAPVIAYVALTDLVRLIGRVIDAFKRESSR